MRGVTRRRFLRGALATSGLAVFGGGLDRVVPGPAPVSALDTPTIEDLTQRRIAVGDIISKDNVDIVRPLLNPGTYEKITRYGMQMPLVPTTVDAYQIVPRTWLDATEQHRGRAALDERGQLWTTEGQPWIGGFPFPEPRTGLEMMWNMASPVWTEYVDDFVYSGGEHLITRGRIARTLEWTLAGISTVGRVYGDPRPYYPDHEHELYRYIITYTMPFDYKGTSILTIRPYDQRQLERAYGYIPAVKRVRQLSTTQRWESAAGNDIFRSDLNGHNDPLGFWEWSLVATGPMLATSLSEGYQVDRYPVVADRFPRGRWELRPNVYVIEGRPKDPACPYSKKILYVDAVLRRPLMLDFYDRRGELWKAVAYFFARLRGENEIVLSYNHPHHCIDLQADHVTYIYLDEKMPAKNRGARITDRWTEEAMLRVAY